MDKRRSQTKKKTGNATTANPRRNEMSDFQLASEVRKLLTIRRGVHKVKLEDLTIPFYIRTNVDPDRASFFRARYEKGDYVAPILVTEETLQVGDGRTRILGAQQAGKRDIDVIFCAEANRETLIAAALMCNAPMNASLPPTEGDILHTMDLMVREGVSQRNIKAYVVRATGLAPAHVRKLLRTIEKRDEVRRINLARDDVAKEVPMAEAAKTHGVPLKKLKDAIAGKKSKGKPATLLEGPKAAITTTATRANRSFGQNFGTATKHFEDKLISEDELESILRHEFSKVRALGALVNSHKDRFEKLTGKKIDIRKSKNLDK